MRKQILSLFIAVIFLGLSNISAQRNLSFIRVSPQAEVSQNIGFAKIIINYSRPAVKGREIWGKLVPYGFVPNAFGNGTPMPWRAGANENTTIFLSHDAKINGQKLQAGIYGIHMIPQENEWTIIFSNDTNSWGSFFYNEKNDALRITSTPVADNFAEWLMYGFENITPNSTDAYLRWEKLKIPFTIEFNSNQIVVDKYKEELNGLAGFNQAAWAGAARFCLFNKINLEEAETWIDKALGMNGGNIFNNKIVKSNFLKLKGQNEEAEKLVASAIEIATENELNVYGYQLLNQGKTDEAIKIFKLNIEKHPDSWNVYDSLGDAYNRIGDKENSKENYSKALELAPANQKSRIEEIIKNL